MPSGLYSESQCSSFSTSCEVLDVKEKLTWYLPVECYMYFPICKPDHNSSPQKKHIAGCCSKLPSILNLLSLACIFKGCRNFQGEVLSTFLYEDGPHQQFISAPQILRFKILISLILLHVLDYYFCKMSLNVTKLAIMSLFYNL